MAIHNNLRRALVVAALLNAASIIGFDGAAALKASLQPKESMVNSTSQDKIDVDNLCLFLMLLTTKLNARAVLRLLNRNHHFTNM